jgi:hypothetical protein
MQRTLNLRFAMRNSGVPPLRLVPNRHTEKINSRCENGFPVVDEFKFNADVVPLDALRTAMKQ